MVAWVTILASYTTANSLTVTDKFGVQYTLCIDDAIIISLVRGANAANKAAAVKPTAPTGSIVLHDILLDSTTAVGALDGEPTRRPQCPDDELRTESDLQWAALRAIQATLTANIQKPDKGPTPTATSTVSLRVDASWAAGTVGVGSPVIHNYRFRWRQQGEDWSTDRTTTLEDVRLIMVTIPDDTENIQMQVQVGNSNGFGSWSDTGTILATDITGPPRIPNKGPTPAATSTASLRIDSTWSAGTVPTGAPAVSRYKFRWRQTGENWSTSQTFTIGNILTYRFTVPDSFSDIQMEVQTGNSNGFGEWSNTGTINAANITDATVLTPNRGPQPAATSTQSLEVDATWAAGSVPSGAPAVNGYQFRWRQAGDGWIAAQTFTLGSTVRAYSFDVPDSFSDIEMEVRTGNTNGYGSWSSTGDIDAADITDSTLLLPNQGPQPTATSTANLRIDATWAAGTVPFGAPAIIGQQFRWRQDGEPWRSAQTFTLGSTVRAYSFNVPDSNEDIKMQVRTRNTNGYGEWSRNGEIDSADITDSTILQPNRGPTPSATSTDSLEVDASWAAGTVPAGAPAVNRYQFRWRQAGEQWVTAQTFTLGNVRAYSFDVPDSNLAIEMEVQSGNTNGYGAWSDTGDIAAADITDATVLFPNRGPQPTATSTATLSIDAAWAAGSVPSGSPAVNGYQFRWRQEGESWIAAQTFTLGSTVRAYSFTVPNANEDIEMEVRTGNTNGYGQWSQTGTLAAADIYNASILTPNRGRYRPRPALTRLRNRRDLGGGHGARWRTRYHQVEVSLAGGWRELGGQQDVFPAQRAGVFVQRAGCRFGHVQMEVQYGNINGFGEWSDTGTIDAGRHNCRSAALVRGRSRLTPTCWRAIRRAPWRVTIHGGGGTVRQREGDGCGGGDGGDGEGG